MEEIKNHVNAITCGITYNFTFSLLDKWGEIADTLLYRDTHFSPAYFPNISRQYTTERRLSNDSLGHYFQLSANSMIYCHVVQQNFDKELYEFSERVIKSLIPLVIDKNQLITKRIGVVYECEISDRSIRSFRNHYFQDDVKDISDFRFAKKESTGNGIRFTNNSDYINKIYTSFPTREKGKNYLSFDYQMYYNPSQPIIDDKIGNVIKTSHEALIEEILSLGEPNGKK